MLALTFPKGVGEADVKSIRQAVQSEASQKGLGPQQGFVLLFVIDELCCNVMEHGRAAWMELKLEAIECHVSQTEGMLEAFGRDFFRKGMNTEFFRPADA